MSDNINRNTEQSPGLKNYTVKPLFSRKTSDIIVAAVLCLLSILAVSAIFWNKLSIYYTVVFDAAVIFISAFLHKKQKPNFMFIAFGILSILCSTSFALTSNIGVKIIILFATAISSVVWFSSAAGNEYKSGDYGIVLFFMRAIVDTLTDLPSVFKGLFAKGEKKSKNTVAVLIGIVCVLPVLSIVVPLLANSDVAFSSLISGLAEKFSEIISRVIIGLVLSVFVISGVFSLKYNDKKSEFKTIKLSVNKITVSTFLSVLSFVYLVYLFSQLAYFFSAFSSILPEGYKFTYAEYARRGFFELCTIASINFVLILFGVLLTEKSNERIPVSVIIPSAFTAVFTIIIIFTALSKMVMYIDAYGLTVLRVCTSAFMIWLFVLFIFMFVRLFLKKLDLIKVGLLVALIILSLMGIGNINAVIAKYNYNAYISSGKEIDVEYISKLGDEGIPYLYYLTKDKNAGISHLAKKELSYKYYDYYYTNDGSIKGIKLSSLKKTDSGILKYTTSRHKAYKILDKYIKEQHGKVLIDTELE